MHSRMGRAVGICIRVRRVFGNCILEWGRRYVLHQYMGTMVGRARKRLNVPYPTLYAVPGVRESGTVDLI